MNPKLKSRIVNDLYIFYRTFVASMFSKNVHAPHIQELSKALMNIVYNPNAKNRLCVAMPPQHSKSSLVTLAFTVWLICRDPTLKILVINAEATLSEKFGIQIRQLMQLVGPLFGISVSNVKSSKTHLMFEKNGQLCTGEIRLTGASGSITGHPVDVCIIDDPYKGIDDITPTLLQKKIDWFNLIVEQRLKEDTVEGVDSKLIIVHTRWHSDDLQGYIWENDHDSYDWISFAAIDENDNILWPQFYSRQFYDNKLRRQGNREFQALYQQKPIDETGDYFDVDKLIFHDTPFNQYYIANCRSWDMAFTKVKGGYDKKKDFTAGVPMFKVDDWHYAICDFEYGQFGDENIHHVQSVARMDTVNTPILIEPGTEGGASGELFRLWDEDYLTGYNCIQSLPKGSKIDRAFAFKHAILDGKIHVYIMDEKKRQIFINQLKAFPNAKHKDIVDACSYAFNYLNTAYDEDIYGTGDTTYGG